jgi:hypothetical protein
MIVKAIRSKNEVVHESPDSREAKKTGNVDNDSGIDTSDSCDEKNKMSKDHASLSSKSEQQHQTRVKRREASSMNLVLESQL